MLLLLGTTDSMAMVTDAAVNVDVHASWVDRTGSTDTPGRTNSVVSSATTTTIVAAAAASTARNVRFISIANRHATTQVTVTVQHLDGTNTIQLIKLVLLAGYTLTYTDAEGWMQIDASGARIDTPLAGRYLASTLITSASGNFTTGPKTNTIKIFGVAGGGGGSGCTSVAAAASAGGGGGAGGYAEKTFAVAPNTAYAFVCGAAGAGASGALGGNGSDSTFIVGATTVTAKGGGGAVVATALTTLSSYKGGAGGVVGTNGDINAPGAPGDNGHITVITPVGASGAGGSGPFGSGGLAISAVGNGTAALGNGGGGGGAMTGASTVRTGGNGTAGCWFVEEYS